MDEGWSAIFFGLTGCQITRVTRLYGGSFTISMLAAAFFLAIPKAIVVASWSYAESLLWLFYALSFGYAMTYSRDHASKDATLALIFAAGAAHTKNEGLLFLILIAGYIIIYAPRRNRSTLAWTSLALIFTLYGPWIIWTRIVLKLESHATSGLTIERFVEIIKRIPLGWGYVVKVWLDFQQWGPALVILSTGILFALFRLRIRSARYLLFPFVYLAALFMVVVGHTADIGWQVGTAWDRLTLQSLPIWILAISACFLKRYPVHEEHVRKSGLPAKKTVGQEADSFPGGIIPLNRYDSIH